MNNGVKAFLYVILVIVTGISGYFFFQNFGRLFDDDKGKAAAAVASEPTPAEAVPPAAAADTNAVADTNIVASATTNVADTATTTNGVEAANVITNATADTNGVATAAAAVAPKAKSDGKGDRKAGGKTAANGSAPRSRLGLWSGAFFLSAIALGGLIAWDIASFMGSRAVKVIADDDRTILKDKEYEEAEKLWANGKPLDSIRMMREYLQKNPREVHVALRIAEIYEKDLNNFLAAALEYEEVLTKKLPDDRWGWSAIHLCNLYFKLGNEQKAYALLQRIVKEYGETPAAEKARKRLKEVDPNLLAEAEAAAPPTKAASVPPPEAEEPKSNLPPGFRPKK